MILHTGIGSIFDTLQKNLDEGSAFTFKEIVEADQVSATPPADVVLIGPDVLNPVKWVQTVTNLDKHVSILVLTSSDRVLPVKHALQFSPFVGKNTTCLTFQTNTNIASALKHAITRTRQKRRFSKLGLSDKTRISDLVSSAGRLENLSNALEQAPIGILLVDQAGAITGANKQSRMMFHQLAATRVELNQVFPAPYIDTLKKAITEEKTERIQIDDGSGNYYEVAGSKVTEGRSTKTLLLINDITERIERDKRIHVILETLPQMAWTATAEGQPSYFSKGWFSYTNQTTEEALDAGWTAVVHPDDVELMLMKWKESVRKVKVYQRPVRFRRHDGKYRWHLMKAVPVYSSRRQVSMWVGTSTDIHDQVLLTEELERKVRERTRSLEEANAELEQFAYVSSHDLQEPLRKIHTFANLVKDNEYEKLSESSKKYLDKVVATAIRMSKLLGDLLDFTRLNSQEAVSDVKLPDVIARISEDLELAIAENKAVIQVGDLPSIRGRPLQLKQLFYNLFNNAIKFRKPEGVPVVRVYARNLTESEISRYPLLSGDGEYWEIIVEDNGIGFEQQYADQIFTVFQRLHGRSAYEGTGIGLAICRKIVSNHKGEIFATSAPGHGAAFHIILPA